jgi:flagellar biosynthesis/type III secretory pathway chaperone
MKTLIQTLEDLFYEKLILYQELVECLKQERQFLIKTDMDALWEISDKKQSIVPRIERVREKMLATLSDASIDHGMDVSSFRLATVLSVIPYTDRGRFKKVYMSLVGLESETRQRSRENRLFVQQSLDFLDELIGIIANAHTPRPVYDGAGGLNKNGPTNLLLSREV